MSAVSIKGIRDGLIVALDDEPPWLDVEGALLETIEERKAFFRGARVALHVGGRTLNRDDIRKLRDKLAEHDIQLAALLGKSADTIRAARREEIPTELRDDAHLDDMDDGELPPIDSNEYGSAGVLVKNTLRSGKIVRHIGHVIVIGDVNPGAQIIAGGDVIVWGRLRGTVHAGANGNQDCWVCALDMRPMQLRIANFVAIASDNGDPRPRPEIASVQEGQIISEEWGS